MNALPVVPATPSIFVTRDLIGVEIEVENMSGSSRGAWDIVREDSIDNGIEFVLTRPLGGEALSDALFEAESLITAAGGTFSECTSTHIHINILDLTLVELTNFLTLLVMLEKVLYKYVDPNRTANHFCWAFGDCEDLVKKVADMYRLASRGRDVVQNHIRSSFSASSCKYAGINLSAIPNYGSLELRMHHGTGSAIDLIRWINIIQSIKQYARQEGRTPSNILDTKISNGIPSIFQEIMGEQFAQLLSYEGVEGDILYGIRLAQDFVNTVVGSVQTDYSQLPTGSTNYLIPILRGMDIELMNSRGRELRAST
jgi:hypothetical protein